VGTARLASVVAVVGLTGMLALAAWGDTSGTPLSGSARSGAPVASLAAAVRWTPAADWPMYLENPTRTAATEIAQGLTVKDVAGLHLAWNFSTGGGVASNPAIVNGTAYVGSWDGYEYAISLGTGELEWKTYLGVDPSCGNVKGITSSATVTDGQLYVGGGNGSWYALNASTGAIEWSVFVGNTSDGYYNWASPLVYDGFAYVGVASKCDHPLVPGGLLQVSLAQHSIVGFFATSPNGTNGSSVWSSPAVDPSTNTLFITTGNPAGKNSTPLSESIIALNATILSLIGSWQVPAKAAQPDGDFGATPTLYPAAAGTEYVSASNKNGWLYTFNASNLSAGPVWKRQVGAGAIAPAAFAEGRLYVGASTITVGGVTYNGSFSAIGHKTGRVLWRIPETQRIYAGAAADGGWVAVGTGPHFQVINGNTGQVVFEFNITGGDFWSAPAISRGYIVVGATNGQIYAFDLRSHEQIPVQTVSPTQIRSSEHAGLFALRRTHV
jgi:outer membrane protein assembly factor BamB